MFRYSLSFILFALLCSCINNSKETTVLKTADPKHIVAVLDSFHAAAARADFNAYFNYFSDDAVFIGTDATELWNKKEFMKWAKPHFDKGNGWSMKAIKRNIYFNNDGSLAWFDELLDTQMKICRGSGVVVKENEKWKVKHYVLSMTVPNADADSVIKIKTSAEDSLINELLKKD